MRAYAYQAARKVGLSTTPCKERVRRLERDGVIQRYQAVLNPAALDQGLVVLSDSAQSHLWISLRNSCPRRGFAGDSGVLFGIWKLRLFAQGAGCRHECLSHALGETLLTLPGVLESTSYVVMEQVSESLMLPVPV